MGFHPVFSVFFYLPEPEPKTDFFNTIKKPAKPNYNKKNKITKLININHLILFLFLDIDFKYEIRNPKLETNSK